MAQTNINIRMDEELKKQFDNRKECFLWHKLI